MEQHLKLTKNDDSPEVDASQYRRLVGRLLYLTVTRLDISFSVNQLSQFLSNPRQSHMNAAMRVLRYLKSTPGQGLLLPSSGSLTLEAYCDASWMSCPTTRRSCTGYYISLGGAPVSWRTKKQSVVSSSSAEAEYRAIATTVCEVLWLRWLLLDLDTVQSEATPLMCDNEAARHIVANPVYHERTKHVEMDCYFVRERVNSGEIKTYAISSELQPTNIFTKALGAKRFQSLRSKLGV
ncbi:secreted RxLR effector protein 161-like [Lactuca sativa]|uniref:secreted RxLR effector protein 161-like n=1 Tax=Lactuca sativa TaxID=4236 RepID=UPI001C68C720|nr:secreted RxLR effector protein 161-like [Lactuca sativa]